MKFSQLPRSELGVDGQAMRTVRALGSCGFNTASPVDVAHINGTSLFVFESGLSTPDKPFFTCVVTGMMSCGGNSREAAMAEGVRRARSLEARSRERRLSYGKLQEMALDPTVFPAVVWQ